MQFLKTKQRFNCQLQQIKLRMVKIKAQDESRMRKIVLELVVPLTENLKASLDERLQPLVNSTKVDEGAAIEGIKVREESVSRMFIYQVNDFRSSTKNAQIAIPEADEGAAECTIVGLKLEDDIWCLVIEVIAPFTQKLWQFAGSNAIDGDMNVLLYPLQQNLDFEAKEILKENDKKLQNIAKPKPIKSKAKKTKAKAKPKSKKPALRVIDGEEPAVETLPEDENQDMPENEYTEAV